MIDLFKIKNILMTPLIRMVIKHPKIMVLVPTEYVFVLTELPVRRLPNILSITF